MITNDEEIARITARCVELRGLHTQCTGRQKLGVVNERLANPSLTSNLIALHYSAAEALARFILMKRTKIDDPYSKYKYKNLDQLIAGVQKLFRNYFADESTQSCLNRLECFSECRNYLVHECAFLGGQAATTILDDGKTLIAVFSKIIEDNHL